MQRKKLTPEQRKKRDEKRERRAAREPEPAAAPPPPPTLGTIIERQDLVQTIHKSVRRMIADTETHIDEYGKTHLKVSSCIGCAAPKGCCSLRVLVYFHEIVPLADRLRRERRDTPELRAALATSADLMETAHEDYRRPCVFLDADERCSVYTHRPIECGTTFVFTPATMCSDRTATHLEKFVTDLGDAPQKMQRRFEREARLVQLPGPYMGFLPRMVLLCLEAYDRPDYAEYLAEQMPLIAKRFKKP